MNQKHLEAFDILFDEIYQKNDLAKALSFQLIEVSQTWDDLYDKDKEVSGDQVNSAFVKSIVEMQLNPLWVQCGMSYHVLNVYLRWRDASKIEESSPSDDDLNKCYMLRAGMYDLFVILAYHLYGDEWAMKIGPRVRRFYGETLKEYKEEMRNA